MLFDNIKGEILNNSRYSVFADDKFIFHERMKIIGIPTSKLFGTHNDGVVVLLDGTSMSAIDFFNGLNEAGAVIKPVIDSSQGNGVIVTEIKKGSSNEFVVKDGAFSSLEFINWINMKFGSNQLLIEGVICQHSVLKKVLHYHSP